MALKPFQICDDDLTPDLVKALAGEAYLAVDTETMGLIPQRDRLCVVQLANAAGEVVLLRFSRGVRQAPLLAKLLTDPGIEKIFHYARFDLAMLRYHLGIQVWPVFCTKIASKLARTYTSKHSLKDVVSELCGVELNKAAQSSDWGAVHALSAEQLEYAANDVRYLIPVRHKLAQMLQREERWELAQRCFQHLPTLVELDLLGYSNVFEHQ
ncbi:ribonuclease D [Synechococcus sp. WC10meta]|uniref:ribonuclease D n=1 Tax=Synechococcus sp. WC10meta TaxID=2964537 RepID=UPI0039C3EC3C